MTKLRVGVAGLGVVGGGLLSILMQKSERFDRAGIEVEIAGISARNRHRDRGVPLEGIKWYDDPVELARSDIDIFIELVGGADGTARAAVEAALSAGKHVITANKALIAEHGLHLARLAEQKGVSLFYEAAVAAGIPAIHALRGGAAASSIHRIVGILNGTCNYMLTQMAETGATYEAALQEAQRLGYAEADPTFDVGGFDAAHKLCILAIIGFDAAVDFKTISISGIQKITAEDIAAARQLNYRIRLLGIATRSESGLELSVHPALVDEEDPIARAAGPDNVLVFEGDPIGRIQISGPGAGAGPTAAAVAADIVTIARGGGGPVFNAPADRLRDLKVIDPERQTGRFYLRITLKDVPGAIAAITDTLARNDISIDSLLQPSVEAALKKHQPADSATLVLTTHSTSASKMYSVAREISEKSFVSGVPSVIRIEDFQ
ncbi:homoserine dehydrogenase [Aquisalinus flavus]|uniref:Homoserine dehydrogenase n=1 Tax=Aquisalinus flavus TaxID=1526572 RepID=A0A8J2Y6H7_9PROT|nr:homoserine dehydrogenase [Aquisalinus flavus]MBD0427711.1 homoserine dehydrogenase [Aquisalinus flavus]GGD03209.1 homoserine dehydrogenase [Aquisalinus flavus]